jgi:uncharacterized membrane protein
LFSLVARVVPVYDAAVPLTLALMGAPWAWHRWRRHALAASDCGGNGEASWDWRADAVLLGVYAVLFLGLLALRAGWASIFWEHDFAHVGSEKLFNYALIQSFLFGQGYPPENLWLAGEPVDYYLLLHALPGLAGWGWRAVTGDAAAGGVLFVFSDVFLLVLAGLALSAWSLALFAAFDAGLSRRQALLLSLGLGIGVFLSTHAKAVRLVLGALLGGADLGWWDLEREAVPYTYSQYPFYLLLLGDHHAFQHVFFLQIALYGVVALLLAAPRLHWPRAALAAALAVAVQLSHSGSVLLDVLVFGLAFAGVAALQLRRGEQRRLRALVANGCAAAAIAVALALPGLWNRNAPSIAWRWVEAGASSPLLGFLEAQAGPLLFVAAACAAGLSAVRAGVRTESWLPLRTGLLLVLVVAATLLTAGRPGAAVAAACALLVLTLAPHRSPTGDDRAPLVILAAAAFAVWLLPEFAVGDFAHRGGGDWKRWNLAMRFWLEGCFLIPFLAVLAFAPAWRIALARRRFAGSLGAVAVLAGSLWLTVHAYSAADRIARTPGPTGLDGTAFLEQEHPCDAAIVRYLRDRPERVRIGELCGTGEFIREIPLDYDWAGRIAAFSGRPGVCGWTRHVWQFSPQLRHESPTGPSMWMRSREYERRMAQAYVAARADWVAVESRTLFENLGVTHVVLGEQEARLFPALSAGRLAHALGGRVEFERGERCAVIRLAPSAVPEGP